MKRDAKVEYFGLTTFNLVEGHQLTLSPRQVENLAAIYMHRNRLYILEERFRRLSGGGFLSAVRWNGLIEG